MTVIWDRNSAGTTAGAADTTAEASNQPQPLEARVPVLADDQMVVHGNPERLCHLDDRLGHLVMCLRRCRIAGGVIVQNRPIRRKYLKFIDQ